MMPRTLPSTLSALLLLASALGPIGEALAGGHGRTPRPEDLLVDPAKRSEITGTVLVTGANRGIGLELARNYAGRGWTVIATARKPEKAEELKALAQANPKVSVERLDLLDQGQVDTLAAKYADQPIDVLLNNAAILGAPADQELGNYDMDLLLRVMNTNVAGPLRMVQAFLDNVAASEQKKIVAITSVQGSLTFASRASIPFYNSSKSALNMVMRSVQAAVKDRGITVALISPGAVDTNMMEEAMAGRNVRMRLMAPADSAEAVINVIDQYGFELSGTFMSHQGAKIPW
jgi:NAD(P)-dependent dehydrogenase (short-subunit alcohol dehydrogenase family)